MVFHIQRYCIDDGDGIRTCVFFKGCPLHCKWCHNIESISFSPQEEFDERIKERLSRAEKKIREEYKGWTSPDDLKALGEKHNAEITKINQTHAEQMKKYEGYDKTFEEQKNKPFFDILPQAQHLFAVTQRNKDLKSVFTTDQSTC